MGTLATRSAHLTDLRRAICQARLDVLAARPGDETTAVTRLQVARTAWEAAS